MRTTIALLLLAAATLASSASAGPPASPGAERDVRLLGAQLESIHPNLFRNVSRTRFRAEVEELARAAAGLSPNELLVGLMGVAALPGARNGHTGLFPLDAHRRTLHLYPLRLYDFADGIHVVGEAADRGLVGSKLVTIAGLPEDTILRRVTPLVPHDNAWSIRGWAPHYALVAEVLDGLGISDGVGPVTFGLERPTGERFEVALEPVTSGEYVAAFADPLHGHYPAALPRRARPRYLAESGRELYLKSSCVAGSSTSATTRHSRPPPRSRRASNAWRGPPRSGV